MLTLVYLVSAVLFILGLKMMAKVPTAKRGNRVSALGMLIATAATFFTLSGGTAISLVWVIVALLIGGFIGLRMATKVEMTGMPQMVALLNGFGGVASLLVAGGDYARKAATLGELGFEQLKEVPLIDALTNTEAVSAEIERAASQAAFGGTAPLVTTALAALIGGVTFTGSLIAFGKLQGVSWVPDQPVQFPGQKVLIAVGLALCLALAIVMAAMGVGGWALILIALIALALGVLLVIGIGGADMPVVIALLNSYSGLAAAMAGFTLNNYALIITGSLVGASGLILTSIMCKAMNRSLANVLFGGMGAAVAGGGSAIDGEARESSPEDAAIVLEAADEILIVPGYGMAVAQAQHAVKELAHELTEKGKRVFYAIHPVAGRMPGHMNVLLAEAGVEYDVLLDLEPSNHHFETADVALVIGANDVTNPDARSNESSPLYGMPILNVDSARTVFVIKRSLNPGFAGIQNPLYFQDNTRMIFGDAKKVVTELANELEAI
ncbi:MAG: NAD(P)(+) transhydrogenase (Re/Si-specific) subunit beta [Planctomycetota bacterium]